MLCHSELNIVETSSIFAWIKYFSLIVVSDHGWGLLILWIYHPACFQAIKDCCMLIAFDNKFRKQTFEVTDRDGEKKNESSKTENHWVIQMSLCNCTVASSERKRLSKECGDKQNSSEHASQENSIFIKSKENIKEKNSYKKAYTCPVFNFNQHFWKNNSITHS